MTTSPRDSSGRSASIVASVGAPAGSMIQIARGAASAATSALERLDRPRAFGRERQAGRRIAIIDDAGMAGAHQPANDIGAHAPETDHAELHRGASS